jgi:hypothetical protein
MKAEFAEGAEYNLRPSGQIQAAATSVMANSAEGFIR